MGRVRYMALRHTTLINKLLKNKLRAGDRSRLINHTFVSERERERERTYVADISKSQLQSYATAPQNINRFVLFQAPSVVITQ